MINATNAKVGLNRTGIMVSPIDAQKSVLGAEELTHPAQGDGTAFAENRVRYIKEADPVGSIPLPTNLRGVASSIQEKLMGGNHAFIDKLGERIAFERTGTRLYEALLSKYESVDNKSILPDITRLEQFYLEELKHFQIASEAMSKIGGDPTAMTPAADISGTAAFGWIQVVTDPRTTFLQSLDIILQAELVDNAGWELLIELAERTGLGELAVQFQQCLDEESFHLITVKQWTQELTLNDEIISPEQNFSMGKSASSPNLNQ